MADLNIRNFPDELLKELKATAASEGVTLRDFTIMVIEAQKRRGGWTAAPEKEPEPVKETVRRREASGLGHLETESKHMAEPPQVAKCKECGALNGLHFRGCRGA